MECIVLFISTSVIGTIFMPGIFQEICLLEMR